MSILAAMGFCWLLLSACIGTAAIFYFAWVGIREAKLDPHKVEKEKAE